MTIWMQTISLYEQKEKCYQIYHDQIIFRFFCWSPFAACSFFLSSAFTLQQVPKVSEKLILENPKIEAILSSFFFLTIQKFLLFNSSQSIQQKTGVLFCFLVFFQFPKFRTISYSFYIYIIVLEYCFPTFSVKTFTPVNHNNHNSWCILFNSNFQRIFRIFYAFKSEVDHRNDAYVPSGIGSLFKEHFITGAT